MYPGHRPQNLPPEGGLPPMVQYPGLYYKPQTSDQRSNFSDNTSSSSSKHRPGSSGASSSRSLLADSYERIRNEVRSLQMDSYKKNTRSPSPERYKSKAYRETDRRSRSPQPVADSKQGAPDALSMLLGNKNVSLSSLLEAAMNPSSSGSSERTEDPIMKKAILSKCEGKIAQLYRHRINGMGTFFPFITQAKTAEGSDTSWLLFHHPRIEFNMNHLEPFWTCADVSVKTTAETIQPKRVGADGSEQPASEPLPTHNIETITIRDSVPPQPATLPQFTNFYYDQPQPALHLPPPPLPHFPPWPVQHNATYSQKGEKDELQLFEEYLRQKEKDRKKLKRRRRSRSRSRSRSRGRCGGKTKVKSRKRSRSRGRSKSRHRNRSRSSRRSRSGPRNWHHRKSRSLSLSSSGGRSGSESPLRARWTHSTSPGRHLNKNSFPPNSTEVHRPHLPWERDSHQPPTNYGYNEPQTSNPNNYPYYGSIPNDPQYGNYPPVPHPPYNAGPRAYYPPQQDLRPCPPYRNVNLHPPPPGTSDLCYPPEVAPKKMNPTRQAKKEQHQMRSYNVIHLYGKQPAHKWNTTQSAPLSCVSSSNSVELIEDDDVVVLDASDEGDGVESSRHDASERPKNTHGNSFIASLKKELSNRLRHIDKVLDTIRDVQRKSFEFSTYIKGLEASGSELDGSYTLHERILCRIIGDPRDSKSALRVVYPDNQTMEILEQIHLAYHEYNTHKVHDMIVNLFFNERNFSIIKIELAFEACRKCNPKLREGRAEESERDRVDGNEDCDGTEYRKRDESWKTSRQDDLVLQKYKERGKEPNNDGIADSRQKRCGIKKKLLRANQQKPGGNKLTMKKVIANKDETETKLSDTKDYPPQSLDNDEKVTPPAQSQLNKKRKARKKKNKTQLPPQKGEVNGTPKQFQTKLEPLKVDSNLSESADKPRSVTCLPLKPDPPSKLDNPADKGEEAPSKSTDEKPKVPARQVDFKDRVRQVQLKLEELKRHINDLEGPEKKSPDPSLLLKAGMLCKRVNSNNKSEVKIVVNPDCLIDMIYIVHTMAPIHAPVRKTILVFNKHFTQIENVDNMVTEVVNKCDVCNK